MRITPVTRSAPVARAANAPAPAKGRWFGTLEAIVGVLIVTAISAVVPGQWGFVHVQPSPLWIVVLAIAIRYGAPSGYVAGVAAAASQCLMLWLRPEARFQGIPEHALIQPFLFIAVAVVLSHALQGQRQRIARLETANRETTDTLESVTQRYRDLHAVKKTLEKQIVGLPDSVMTLYEVAKGLETLRTDALHPAILALVERFLQTESCTLYRVTDGHVQMLAHLPSMHAINVSPLPMWDGLIEQAVRSRQIVTVRDRLLREGPEAVAKEPIVAAGPLFDANGDVIAVIAVERMPFLALAPTNLRLFRMILDWGSTALQNAARYEETQEHRLVDETTGVYIAPHTMRLVREESERSQRYRLPLSIVTMHVEWMHAVRPEMAANVLATVTAIAQLSLRTVDIIGHHPNPGTFVLILPMTDAAKAEIVVGRIEENLQGIAIRPYTDDTLLTVGFNVLTRDGEAAEPARPRIVARDGVATDEAGYEPVTILYFPEADVAAVGD